MNKKELKERIDWYFLNSTGYRRINGGFAEAKIDEIEKLEKGITLVRGKVEYGECDMGGGGSVTYKDVFRIYFDSKEKMLNREELKAYGIVEEDD